MQMQTKRENNKQFPRTGDYTDLFERLSEYINEFDREWLKRIKPASKESVDLLMDISEVNKWKNKLPKSYFVFLEHMGENDGGLLSEPLLGTADVREIIDMYKEYHEFEPEDFEKPFFTFFQNEVGDELSFDLSGKNNEKIFYGGGGYFSSIVAESFEKLLFQCAFNKFERYNNYIEIGNSLEDIKKAMSMSNTNEVFDVVHNITHNYNLEKAWFSDSKNYIAFNKDVCFRVEDHGSIIGSIRGNNKNVVEEISKVFAEKLLVKLTYK